MSALILVHGGAGDIIDKVVPRKLEVVKAAAKAGYDVLAGGGTALDAVEAAVRLMEDDECMNAGKGSCLNFNGDVQMDAAIMDGEKLDAGAVGAVQNIAHPITLARLVSQKTPHVFLVGDDALNFAEQQGMEILPPKALVIPQAEKALELSKKLGGLQGDVAELDIDNGVGTVGAVAIDSEGHVAAATSTGGLNGKLPGRVGDSPIIGAGTYADDEIGAVSATGHGEAIMKICLAVKILSAVKIGTGVQEATDAELNALTRRLDKTAGAICVSKNGDIGVGMTTKRMPWACMVGDKLLFGVEQNEKQCEYVSKK